MALRNYYAKAGFSEVGRRDFEAPWHSAVLLEKVLHEPVGLAASDDAAPDPRQGGRDWQAWHKPYEDP